MSNNILDIASAVLHSDQTLTRHFVNDTWPDAKSALSDLFDRVCFNHGDETAIYNGNNIEIGFTELQENAYAIAAQLVHVHNVQPHDPVILLDSGDGNNVAVITSLLACLRIGAPIVPIQANNCEYINLVNARVALVVADNYEHENIEMITKASDIRRFVYLNAHDGSLVTAEAIMNIPNDLPDPPRFDLSVLYDSNANMSTDLPPLALIFTSGSTGQPKAVRLTHVGFANRLSWQWQAYPYDTDNALVARRTPIVFIDAFTEILAPLLQGIPMCIGNDNATHITLTPSLLKIMLRMHSNWSSLQHVTASGEAITGALVNDFYKVFDTNVRLLNLYGSTEVTGDCTFADLTIQKDSVDNSISIGRPISNTTLAIADDILYVTGLGLADGYHNVVNDKAFFTENDNTNWFCTGDIVEISDNILYYKGRKDRRIKINGICIELDSVEAKLHSILNTDVSVTATDQISEDGLRMVAVVTTAQSTSVIRQQCLQEKMSLHLIPSLFLTCDELPYTHSKKINRREIDKIVSEFLVTPVHTAEIRKRQRVNSNKVDGDNEMKTASNTRTVLHDILNMVLGTKWQQSDTDSVDYFYSAGGTSLQAIEVLWMIKNEIGVSDLQPSDLGLSMADLVNKIDSLRSSSGRPNAEIRKLNQCSMKIDCACDHNRQMYKKVIVEDKQEKNYASHNNSFLQYHWRVKMQRCVDAAPVTLNLKDNLDNDNHSHLTYIGSHGGDFMCFNVRSKTIVWNLELRGRVHAAAISYSLGNVEAIAVSTYLNDCHCDEKSKTQGILYAIEACTGNLLWTSEYPAKLKCSAVFDENKLWQADTAGSVTVVDCATGEQVCNISLQGGIEAQPIVTISSLLVATTAGMLYRLQFDKDSISILWEVDLSTPVYSGLVLVGQNCLVCGVDGNIRLYSCKSGELLYIHKVCQRPIFASPLITSYDQTKIQLTIGSLDKHVYSLTISLDENGGWAVNKKWQSELDAVVYARPCQLDETTITVCTTAGSVYLINSVYGEAVSRVSVDGQIFSNPTSLDNYVIFGCRDDYVYCFTMAD